MKNTLMIAITALGLSLSSAHAAAVYADAVDWQNNGTVGSNNQRDEPTNALGAPDGSFLALGLSQAGGSNPGFAVFRFDGVFPAGSGVSVIETTFNCREGASGACTYPESAKVYYGNDYDFGAHDLGDVLDDFTLAREVFNYDAQSGASLTALSAFTYVAIVDTSRSNFGNGPSTDGFDIESIAITTANVTETPVPGAALLMATGGILAFRRRNKA